MATAGRRSEVSASNNLQERLEAEFGAEIATRLKQWPDTWRALSRLAGHGADPVTLVYDVVAIRIAHDLYRRDRQPKKPQLHRWAFDHFIGFDRKQLKTVINRMRQCAQDVQRIRIGFVIQSDPGDAPIAAKLNRPYRPIGLRDTHSRLPHDLTILADSLERTAGALRLKGRPHFDQNVASLVQYVKLSTDKFHDQEVSALIAFSIGSENYDAEALKVWRNQHTPASLPRKR